MKLATAIALLASNTLHTKAATVSLIDLAGQTADHTSSVGTIASSVFTNMPIDSTQDITFQFEANFLTADPSGEHTLFEFGGGAGTGISLILSTFNNRIRFQAEQGANQAGVADVSLLGIPLNEVVTVTASLQLSSSTLNLFINNELVSSVSGPTLTDWAGGNEGGFFAPGGNAVLRPNFGNGTAAAYPGPTPTDATAISGLRFYENTFVASVPEPSTSLLALMAIFGLLRRRA